MADVLTLATAGLKSGQLYDRSHQRYPRVDYLELKRCLDLEVFDYAAYDRALFGRVFRQVETCIRSDLYLSLLGLAQRHKYSAVLAMSERTAIPFAGLSRILPGKRPLIAIFNCWSNRQERVIRKLHLFEQMDAIVVHCNSMKRQFVKLGAPQNKVHLIPYSVDERFFRPMPEFQQEEGFIFSIGEVRSRTYGTLFEAISGSRGRLKVAASGSWYAREANDQLESLPPSNVTVVRALSQREVRQQYALCQFVVLPVRNLTYSAGATAAMEAACMERAVIATRSPGITDFVVDQETGILVEPGNGAALRDAIQFLLSNPAKAKQMGQNARERVEREFNLDNYVSRLATLLKGFL